MRAGLPSGDGWAAEGRPARSCASRDDGQRLGGHPRAVDQYERWSRRNVSYEGATPLAPTILTYCARNYSDQHRFESESFGPAGARRPRVSDSAEIYDPATGTFELAGTMPEARADHTATLPDDGGCCSPVGSIRTGMRSRAPTAGIAGPSRVARVARHRRGSAVLGSGECRPRVGGCAWRATHRGRGLTAVGPGVASHHARHRAGTLHRPGASKAHPQGGTPCDGRSYPSRPYWPP
jgi:hypothetical protein